MRETDRQTDPQQGRIQGGAQGARAPPFFKKKKKKRKEEKGRGKKKKEGKKQKKQKYHLLPRLLDSYMVYGGGAKFSRVQNVELGGHQVTKIHLDREITGQLESCV